MTERFLHLIWVHQRLRRLELLTTDGQPVLVLHPGFWNHEAGPDFRDAVIQIGDGGPRPGDVEIDLVPSGWHAHGHDVNPAYKQVLLHVVWEAETSTTTGLPTLALRPFLDSPLEELHVWLRKDPGHELPALRGKCSPGFGALDKAQLATLLDEAAEMRLQTKAGQLEARARQAGWEQALWEGLFGALGYKQNVWPMQRLSEILGTIRQTSNPHSSSALEIQARLLGISGLLPHDMQHSDSGTQFYLRRLWDLWWRDREQYGELALPPSLWRLHGLRPANHPHRRIALAAQWVAENDLPNRLERWFSAAQPNSKLPLSLMECLQPSGDEFWSRHWTLRSAPMPKPKPLVGAQRTTDLAVNVILPWFWIRAATGQNTDLQERARACYFAWPKGEDNAVLRRATGRLFGASKPALIDTAARQQGLLQIVRDFCDYSNSVCDGCPLPGFLENTMRQS